jgi:ABC-type uncharacterized transport system permease subunit
VRRHSFDLLSCIAGLLFAGLAVAYVVGAYTDVSLDGRLVLPIVLVGLGLAGLAASLLAQHRSNQAVSAAQQQLD